MAKLFSERLRDVRTYYDYSQRELADMLGVTRTVYTDWELYRKVIPLKYLNKLANFYKVNIDYLLGLTDITTKVNLVDLDINIISSNLFNLRTELNLTTREFANILHISNSSVTRYEKAKILISTSACYSIARNYNISIDYILGRSKIKYINQ